MTRGIYQIKVKGQLDTGRSEWFEGWTITQENDSTTLLIGPITGQSALHGVLTKLLNLNLAIVSGYCVQLELEKG